MEFHSKSVFRGSWKLAKDKRYNRSLNNAMCSRRHVIDPGTEIRFFEYTLIDFFLRGGNAFESVEQGGSPCVWAIARTACFFAVGAAVAKSHVSDVTCPAWEFLVNVDCAHVLFFKGRQDMHVQFVGRKTPNKTPEKLSPLCVGWERQMFLQHLHEPIQGDFYLRPRPYRLFTFLTKCAAICGRNIVFPWKLDISDLEDYKARQGNYR